ncbi:MAG: hypothetical protein OEW33_02180 [Nitrospirota bacterium]|nr:hypothetical protein [Nitrospirota bacterium]
MMERGRSVKKIVGLGALTLCVMWGAPAVSFSQVVQALTVEERLERLEQKTLSVSPGAVQETGNMVFFRGGWANLTNDRSNEVFTDVYGFSGSNDNNTGYYVGAGLDLMLTRNVWDLLPGTWVLGEIGVEFKRFNSEKVTQAVPSTCGAAIPSSGCTVETNKKVQITMLTVNVAPKLMFMEGSRFRPWIIPVGLDFHVISPPSNDTTVLDIGVQFALGAQVRVWKALHLGVDGRFHLATGQTDTTNNFGTAGAYLGIAF